MLDKHSKREKSSSPASSRKNRSTEGRVKASISAMAREQNKETVNRGEKTVVEIEIARFQTLNNSIDSLMQQNEATPEQ